MRDIIPIQKSLWGEYNLYGGFFKKWGDPGGIVPFNRLDWEGNNGLSLNIHSQSNLKTGDIVLEVNGQKTPNWETFWSFVKNPPAGVPYTFKVIRNGKEQIIRETFLPFTDGYVKFREYRKTPRPWIGAYLSQTTDLEWHMTLKMHRDGKLRYSVLCSVLEVKPGSPADKAGLKPLDIIVDYGADDNNGEVMAEDVIEYLHDRLPPGQDIEFTIFRDLKDFLKIKVTPQQSVEEEYF